MHVQVKIFEELTTNELYQIMRLRSEVFVVEQECLYQDLDNKDQKAIHVFAEVNNQVVAYTRMFAPGDYFDNTSIGRVVVAKEQRKFGYGKRIMLASLDTATKKFPESPVEISAQTYLTKFYRELGFEPFGKQYLEDGIPHIRMLKK